MTVSDANGTPHPRVQIISAIMTHRQRGSERLILEAVAEAAGPVHEDPPPRIEYADGTLTVDLTEDQRAQLDTLLKEFPVFKPEQPATRPTSGGIVSLSAIADPKHTADFIDAVFRSVYGLPDGYTVQATQE